jgi:uncharacterized glyoxalase superfamily protein PhnB
MVVEPIPDGYHSATPFLMVEGAAELMVFMKQAFAAQEVMRMEGDGHLMHGQVQIGDSKIMMADAGDMPPVPGMVYLYVEDVDSAYESALQAGATSMQEPADQFYGDRTAGVKDRFGNQWWIATRVEDVSPDEMQRRQEAMTQQHA